MEESTCTDHATSHVDRMAWSSKYTPTERAVQLNKELQKAAERGDIRVFRETIERGADVLHKEPGWYGRTCLHTAAEHGREDIVREILDAHGVDINIRDDFERTPLWWAVRHGHIGCSELLLNSRAVIDGDLIKRWGSKILMKAANEGKIEVATEFIKFGADLNKSLLEAANLGESKAVVELIRLGADHGGSLLLAAKQGESKTLIELIRGGADPNRADHFGRLPIHHAVTFAEVDCILEVMKKTENLAHRDNNGNTALHYFMSNKSIDTSSLTRILPGFLEKINIFSCNNDGFNPIHVAVLEQNCVILQQCIQISVDIVQVNSEDWHPLHVAAIHGFIDECKCLLSCKGCDVNVKTNQGLTAVHCASMTGVIEVIRSLLEAGADLEVIDNYGRHALHYAAMFGNTLALKYLIDHGVLVDAVDKSRKTALHYAVQFRHIQVVSTLIDAKASATYRDDNDKTPMQYLCEFEQSQAIGDILNGKTQDVLNIDLGIEGETWTPKVTESLTLFQVKDTRGLGRVKSISKFDSAGFVKSIQKKITLIICTSLARFVGDGHKVRVVGCGSSYDGSKCGLPDELDYLIVLKTIELSGAMDSNTDGYERMNPRIDISMNAFQSFAAFLWNILFTYWKQHMDELCALGNGRIQLLLPPQRRPNRTACVNWKWLYSDEVFSSLPVSIDLVPSVEVECSKDYFPEEVRNKLVLVEHEDNFGCVYGHIVPKIPQLKHWRNLMELLEQEDLTHIGRISFPLCESCAIRRIPQRLKDVIVTAKSVRSPTVCGFRIRTDDGDTVDVGDYITSYHLKTVFLNNVEYFRRQKLSLESMVCFIYRSLVKHYEGQTLPMALKPDINILVGSRLNPGDCLKVARIMADVLSGLQTRDMEHYDQTEEEHLWNTYFR